MRSAASGRASEPAAALIRASRSGSRISASASVASRAASSSASATTTAAPASAIQRALPVWWSAVACGYGTRIAGRPAAASSNTEPPARAAARSAAAYASANGSTYGSGREGGGGAGLSVGREPVVRRRAELVEAGAQLVVVAPAARVQDVEGRLAAESLDR